MLPFLLPLALMQVGPAPTTSPITAVPPELQNRPPRDGVRTAPLIDRGDSRPAIDLCLQTARSDAAKALDMAEEWVSRTSGTQRATGRHCLGVAAGYLGDWDTAAAAFTAAREETTDTRFRARMGALAGSALLAQGKPDEALTVLDPARAEAAGEDELTSAIDLDRATALVSLGKMAEASAALSEARTMAPDEPHAWLLSATLSRRQDDLVAAQAQIEKAVQLDPTDPAIGLEAGVIAALGGRTEAARKSFESVIAADADGPYAAPAKAYLTQVSQ